METKKTNKELLIKGIKTLALTIMMVFTGPTLFYVANSNQEKPLYIPLIVISVLICILAIYMAFRGIRIILEGIFS